MPSASRQILTDGAHRLGLVLERTALERLLAYHAELRKWNRKINLVAQAPELELLETHFLDSLTLLPLLSPAPTLEPLDLLDIGSGAGFPGLVLKCCLPDRLAVTLAEPRQKRVAFLRQVVRTVGLGSGIEVLARRLEPGESGSWPLITSRAFASITDFLNLCGGLSPPGGRVICMKGPRAEEELALWQRQGQAEFFRLEEVRSLSLPFSGAARHLLVFQRH
ncbi:MAG TPA: 16S rRNA (guanine(527)-N(7))-methyltransferase RsmG [Desulfurivibrio alkaliphilus]|uniref:Ribosomal RNA small subunit methyltransferase G n=1 Tax=Desulfurivibrio alkaliphilus TaxID=427923 RepID=A0A7C2TKF2_9BACT|nr:16S rRNA (guanine(527)-N(7))-methyltransferase RsmG [Desulfurivibrio alkaliphilus]